MCRSLVYPDGFGAHNDGGLKVVPGAHLYRSRDLADSEPTAPAYEYSCVPGEPDDADFSGSWLKDKLHPITGEPLKIQKLELPPGSMVSNLALSSPYPHLILMILTYHRLSCCITRHTRWSPGRQAPARDTARCSATGHLIPGGSCR